MKILTVVGARPQFVKVSPVTKLLRESHKEILVHTGQHYDRNMSDVLFEQLNIPDPDYNLGIGSGSHAIQVSEMLLKLEEILINEKPDLVLVYGDTNSTLAGALAAVKLGIHIAHVEAGPRNNKIHIPEMINRKMVDHVSSLLLCATQFNADTLKSEGIIENVFFVGDVMLDSLLQNITIAEENSKILDELQLKNGDYCLATIHRGENTDEEANLRSIVDAFIESDKKIVFSIHPRTIKCLSNFNLLERLESCRRIIITQALPYMDFLVLEKNCEKVITDSGGVQREAYFLQKPSVNIYDHSVWPELVEEGWSKVTGFDKTLIKSAIRDFNPIGKQNHVFGEGHAAEKIVNKIENYLKDIK